eukprot:Pgem_evm2s12364
MTPLLVAVDRVRVNWIKTNGKGRNTLEKLLDVIPSRLLGVTLQRVSSFRKWSDKRIVNCKPNWKPADEYTSSQSKSLFHALVCCPDVEWVDCILRKIIKHVQSNNINVSSILNFKGYSRNDVVGLALD